MRQEKKKGFWNLMKVSGIYALFCGVVFYVLTKIKWFGDHNNDWLQALIFAIAMFVFYAVFVGRKRRGKQ